MREVGEAGWRIELIEDYHCKSKNELTRREGQLIRELKPELNILIAGRTPKEHYEENKEAILENRKVYYEQNKGAIIERQTRYYERNRDKLLQPSECECGGRYTQQNKSRHFKSQMHQNYLADLNNPAE